MAAWSKTNNSFSFIKCLLYKVYKKSPTQLLCEGPVGPSPRHYLLVMGHLLYLWATTAALETYKAFEILIVHKRSLKSLRKSHLETISNLTQP